MSTMKKLRIDVSKLFAVHDRFLIVATSFFDVEIIDESGQAIGHASIDLRGKIGGGEGKSSYVKEYEISPGPREGFKT